MGIVFRQSVKTTIITFAGALLGALTVYASTKLMSQQAFGYSRNLLSQAVLASNFILFGVHNMLYVYVYKYDMHDERRKVLFTISAIVPIIITLLFSIVYFALRDVITGLYQAVDMEYVLQYYTWLPIYVLLWSVMTLLEQYLNSQMKVAISTFTKEILLRCINIILVLLMGFGYISFHSFMLLSILVHIVPILLLLRIAMKTEGAGFSANWQLFSKSEYKEIASFAAFHLLINAAISLLINVDTQMLGILDKEGMATVAVYSVCILIISIFQIPYRSLAAAATPMVTKAYNQNDHKQVKDLFNRSSLNIQIVAAAMALLILGTMQNIISVFDSKYAGIGIVVPVLMIGRLFDMLTGINSEMLSMSQYYKLNFYITVLLVSVIIILNYFLIPQYGLVGAAWANTIGFFLFNLIKLFYLHRKMGLMPLSKNTWLILCCTLPPAALCYLLPSANNVFADVAIRSLGITILFAGMLLWLQPSPDIKNYLRAVKENKRLF
jgi:O-antigen/teichoic acid export membrane protein